MCFNIGGGFKNSVIVLWNPEEPHLRPGPALIIYRRDHSVCRLVQPC